jgi:hypothetical protein
MEAEKRVSEIDWSWAVSKIDQAINQQMTLLENDDTLSPETRELKVYELQKAWQRILCG